MNKISTALILSALSGCASYHERGTGDGGREIDGQGYTTRCDAAPPNQPGCYSPPPTLSLWPTDRIELRPRED